MIRIFLGNVGSGKTASMVREMYMNRHIPYYSNIETKNLKHNTKITKDMLVVKDEVVVGKRIVEKYRFNREFWQLLKQETGVLNVVIDEAHTLLNSRRAMSKQNEIMSDYLALLRRIVGSNTGDYGSLTLITQLDRRLDVIAREMATQVRFHRCYYQKTCRACQHSWRECNEDVYHNTQCPKCDKFLIRSHSHIIEVFVFTSMDSYSQWSMFGQRTYVNRYFIVDINKYFSYYDTLQWDNLFD